MIGSKLAGQLVPGDVVYARLPAHAGHALTRRHVQAIDRPIGLVVVHLADGGRYVLQPIDRVRCSVPTLGTRPRGGPRE